MLLCDSIEALFFMPGVAGNGVDTHTLFFHFHQSNMSANCAGWRGYVLIGGTNREIKEVSNRKKNQLTHNSFPAFCVSGSSSSFAPTNPPTHPLPILTHTHTHSFPAAENSSYLTAHDPALISLSIPLFVFLAKTSQRLTVQLLNCMR